MKIADAVLRKEKRKLTMDSSLEPGKSNFFKKGLKSLKGLLASKEKEKQQQEDMVKYKNITFLELSRFVQYFINFGLPYSQANELLISLCETYQLEQSRVHLLLTELISNQKKTTSLFTDEKESMTWCLHRRNRRLKSFGGSDLL